jgi:hypothetical protein
LEQAGSEVDTAKPVQVDQNISFSCGASLSEDDEELTESKIRAFLGEKVLLLISDVENYPFPSVVWIWIYNILIFNCNFISQALELKKLQTPLYEEFYNSLNASFSPSYGGSSRDETPPNYLKLPPKSKSPSRIPVGSPSTASDAVSTGSPGSNRRASNVGNASDEASEDNSSPRSNDRKGLQVDGQPETSSPRLAHMSHP